MAKLQCHRTCRAVQGLLCVHALCAVLCSKEDCYLLVTEAAANVIVGAWHVGHKAHVIGYNASQHMLPARTSCTNAVKGFMLFAVCQRICAHLKVKPLLECRTRQEETREKQQL